MKPPIKRIVKTHARRLKYLSINDFIPAPNLYISHPTRKNLADLLTIEAVRKTGKFILNAPAEMVKTLYGTGVNPAIPTAQAL